MGKFVTKGSAFCDSNPRMNSCEEEPAWGSLKAAIKYMRNLAKDGMSERSHKGVASVHEAVKGDLRPVPVSNTKGKTPLLSTFDGQDSRNFIPWLVGLKCYFEGNHLSDSEKCEVGVSCLKGSALVWLTTLNMSRFTNGKGTIKSWHKLEFHMKEKYTPFCEMPDLKTTKKTLSQNPLSTNKNAKPGEKPQPDIESKLETVTTCLKPKPESTEQTSLKMVFPIDKMNQPLSGESLESEPEIVKQTELEMACSPTEVNHVSVACTVRCLSPLKNESLSVSHGRVVEHPAPTSPEPLKLTYTGFTPTHCKSKNQIPHLSPNKPTLNHLLIECPTKKINQSTSHFTTEIHESLVKPHPTFETCTVRGKSPDLSTPHFHYYMLMRLMTDLGKVDPYLHLLNLRKIILNLQGQMWADNMHVGEHSRHLKGVCYVLLELEKGLSTSELFVPRSSKWKSSSNGEMDQISDCCPGLQFMFVWGHGSSKLSETCEISFALVITSLLSNGNGSSTPMGPCELLTRLNSCITVSPHLSLSMNDGLTAIPRELGYAYEDPSCIKVAYLSSHESLSYSVLPPESLNGSCVEYLAMEAILMKLNKRLTSVVFYLLGLSKSQPEHEDAICFRPRHFILVFDPGGNDVILVHEIAITLLIDGCMEIFFSYLEVKFF